MIPEDFTLRRHYLTEIKNKQQCIFDEFTSVAMGASSVDSDFPVANSGLSVGHVCLGLAIFLFIFVIF